MMGRDYQKSRVYRWENTLPRGFHIPFDDLQTYVNIVWQGMGLDYPPLVTKMHGKDRHSGKANRGKILFPAKGACQQTVLHELAHSMTMGLEGRGHAHNEYFVGVYMKLLERFMGLNAIMLYASAEKMGVKYVRTAKPTIVNGGVAYAL